jgi:hypothetical protein
LERGRTRPFVVFDLITEDGFVHAQIANIGQTTARGIKISVTPQIKGLWGGPNAFPPEKIVSDIAFIENGVAMMPPGRKIKGLVAHLRQFAEHYKELRFEGMICYTDSQGAPYTDPIVFDLTAEKGLCHIGKKDINDVAKYLEELSKTLADIAIGYRKPLIRTITEEDYQEQQERREQDMMKQIEGLQKKNAQDAGATFGQSEPTPRATRTMPPIRVIPITPSNRSK